jgi:hypothetical protein
VRRHRLRLLAHRPRRESTSPSTSSTASSRAWATT